MDWTLVIASTFLVVIVAIGLHRFGLLRWSMGRQMMDGDLREEERKNRQAEIELVKDELLASMEAARRLRTNARHLEIGVLSGSANQDDLDAAKRSVVDEEKKMRLFRQQLRELDPVRFSFLSH